MIPAALMMSAPPLQKGAVCLYPWSDSLARLFTLKSKFEDDAPITLWRKLKSADGTEYIGLPWFCCPEVDETGHDTRVAGARIEFTSHVVPKDEAQADCIEKTKAFLRAGQSGVLKAMTGTGKTVMAIDVIADHGRTTLIVCPKDDLVDQWLDRLCGTKPGSKNPMPAFSSLLRSQVGRIQGDVCDYQGKPVVVGSLRSLCKPNRYPPEMYRYFGLIVGDEIHRWAADYMGVIATLFEAKQRLGLSATPERADGREVQVAAHVGPIRVEMEGARKQPKVFRYKTNWKCPRGRTGERLPHSAGKIALILPSLMNHGRRNQMICHFAKMAYAKGRNTVVFSDYTEHLDMLAMMLPKYGIPLAEVGRYYGSGKDRSGDALKAHGYKRLVLATPGKAGDGTDYPQWDTMILGSPRSNIEQMVGRILRDDPQNPDKVSVVFDLIDDDSPVLRSYSKSRKGVYLKLKATAIIDAEIADEELVAYSAAA